MLLWQLQLLLLLLLLLLACLLVALGGLSSYDLGEALLRLGLCLYKRLHGQRLKKVNLFTLYNLL